MKKIPILLLLFCLLTPPSLGESLSLEEMLGASSAGQMHGAQLDPVPHATSFWDMDPDAYDLANPDHQRAIWEILMQPITVLDVGQVEHVYPTRAPGLDRRPWQENTTGELHGQSQGVNVLSREGDWALIEAYSNDGTKTGNSYMKSINNKRIQGYVKSRLLKTVTPSDEYALLVDKMRQKMYIFQQGAIIGTLDVSTGRNNEKQPYNETPAGEFLTVSWVGEMVSGTMRERFSIRINGGTTLHEVPHRLGADGKTRLYDEFEKLIGQKASHACVRIQRTKNAQGQNAAWIWDNISRGDTKVMIWDDVGRKIPEPEVPDPATPLYREPGKSLYHLHADCDAAKGALVADLTYGDLVREENRKLRPCSACGAPPRPETLYERYAAQLESLGVPVPEDARAAFGLP